MRANAKSTLESEIRSVAAEVTGAMGLELVEIVVRGHSRKWRVRIDIDRAGPAGVRIEDCEAVSTELGRLLDERDVVPDSYVLEVSSPGLDRPIQSDDDIRRNTGRRVVVITREPIEERKRFRGVLVGADGEQLRVLEDAGVETCIPRGLIVRAHQEIEFG